MGSAYIRGGWRTVSLKCFIRLQRTPGKETPAVVPTRHFLPCITAVLTKTSSEDRCSRDEVSKPKKLLEEYQTLIPCERVGSGIKTMWGGGGGVGMLLAASMVKIQRILRVLGTVIARSTTECAFLISQTATN